ncbi:hypothetical protein K435DRAFT_877568 [Dendrothele bispora CBS 962.96]|uniref:Uncharacterized protein n=1 Tax=Dendrothele bispora (strain CBS 962.96) TaxID=1314807 RepID=A0A4S8KPM3_DENBC|nr:hypothetical protein K435DRAFT_877568 [Dendrothele bispora CBS 962.96]
MARAVLKPALMQSFGQLHQAGNGMFGPGGDMLCVENCMLAHSFYEQRMIDLKDSSTETLVVRLSSLLIPLCSGFCKCVNFWNLMCCYIAEMLCAHYDDL